MKLRNYLAGLLLPTATGRVALKTVVFLLRPVAPILGMTRRNPRHISLLLDL